MSYYQAEQPYNTPGTKNDRPNVVFYSEAKPDAAATKKDGLPRFKDIELCRVTFPADRARTLIRPAHAEWTKDRGQIVTYAMRFPEEYKRFKAGQGPVVRGTPVSEAPFLRESQRQMLRALECYTIEQSGRQRREEPRPRRP